MTTTITTMKEVFESKDVIVHFNRTMHRGDYILLTDLVSLACNYNASYEFNPFTNLLIVTGNTIQEKEKLYESFSERIAEDKDLKILNPWFEGLSY